jgi:hypothetical protein
MTTFKRIDCPDGEDCTNLDHIHDPDGLAWVSETEPPAPGPPPLPPTYHNPRRRPRFTWTKE